MLNLNPIQRTMHLNAGMNSLGNHGVGYYILWGYNPKGFVS